MHYSVATTHEGHRTEMVKSIADVASGDIEKIQLEFSLT